LAKFKFSLEKVLDYRWLKEQEAKREYASAQKALTEQEDIFQQINQEKENLMEVRESTINRMQVQQWYLLDLNQRLIATTEAIKEMSRYVEQALSVYIEAQQERKILEKLSEKQLAEYQIEMNREEQKMLDEMANRKQIS
jgi:flagellar FliJ protein